MKTSFRQAKDGYALSLLFGGDPDMHGPAGSMTQMPFMHGMIGARDAAHDASTMGRPLVLSGGGIDSFVSAALYAKAYQTWCNRFSVTGDEEDDDSDDFSERQSVDFSENRFTFVAVNYGQHNWTDELLMVEAQAKLSIFNNEWFPLKPKIIIIEDGLTAFLNERNANPLANRDDVINNSTDLKSNDDYVPNRNARFLFQAAGIAEVEACDTIIIGAVGSVNIDNSLPFFISAHETISKSSRDWQPRIYVPFAMLTKAMVAQTAHELNVTRFLATRTISCFNPMTPDMDETVVQCGICRSCNSLKQAFAFTGLEDPYLYADDPHLRVKIVELDSVADNGKTFSKKGKSKGMKLPKFELKRRFAAAATTPVVNDGLDDDDDDADSYAVGGTPGSGNPSTMYPNPSDEPKRVKPLAPAIKRLNKSRNR